MKRMVLLGLALSCCIGAKAHAMAVFDASNLAQNVISAQQSILQVENQIAQITNQINQYQRMLQDAMNPGSWEWGDITKALEQLKNSMNSIKGMSGSASGLDSYLSKFGDYESYQSRAGMYGTQNEQLHEGEYQAQKLQKESTDELLKLIKKQQEELDGYAQKLEALKSKSAGAQGQQEAIQAGNEFASMQLQMLTNIHAVLLAQNTMLAAISERESDEAARKKTGTEIVQGTPEWVKTLANQKHNPSYRNGFFE